MVLRADRSAILLCSRGEGAVLSEWYALARILPDAWGRTADCGAWSEDYHS
jgi:hypothetical protein